MCQWLCASYSTIAVNQSAHRWDTFLSESLLITQPVKLYSHLSHSAREIITVHLPFIFFAWLCRSVSPKMKMLPKHNISFHNVLLCISVPLEMLATHSVGKTEVYTAGEVLMSSVWDSWQEDGEEGGFLPCFDSPSIYFSPLRVAFWCRFYKVCINNIFPPICFHVFTEQKRVKYLLAHCLVCQHISWRYHIDCI